MSSIHTRYRFATRLASNMRCRIQSRVRTTTATSALSSLPMGTAPIRITLGLRSLIGCLTCPREPSYSGTDEPSDELESCGRYSFRFLGNHSGQNLSSCSTMRLDLQRRTTRNIRDTCECGRRRSVFALGLPMRGLALFDALHGDPLPTFSRRSLAVKPMTCPANASTRSL